MARIENRVQQLRHGLGMTQEELAEKAKVTRQTIIAIEKGNYAPSVVLALRLAHILKTSVEQLFTLI
ncbi:MAG TPA: helix-turn-helix transcriptional regulator [Candidatus Paceibacterota bacterium]|nr:helix-turn-helix transcriptional regulator [Candidatus Paceibacterota bacterium]